MKRDFLENLGIGKDEIDTILNAFGAENEKYKTESASLKDEIANLKDELSKKDELYAKDMDCIRLSYAIDDALKSAGAKSIKAAKALIDTDKIEYADGKAVGLTEQLDRLKAENAFLFESESSLPKIVMPTQGAKSMSEDEFLSTARKAAGLF